MFAGLNPEEWTAVGTLGTAIVALLAAVFAGWQVCEIRRARQEESRPFVIVDIQSSAAWNNLLNLVIENAGPTLARDVRVSFTPPLQSSNEHVDLESTVLLTEGIPMLPPGRQVKAFFDASHERKGKGLPMRYDVEVALKDYRGQPQEVQRYVIDLGHLYGLSNITEYGMHDAAKALREIQTSVTKWSDIHGRLKVWGSPPGLPESACAPLQPPARYHRHDLALRPPQESADPLLGPRVSVHPSRPDVRAVPGSGSSCGTRSSFLLRHRSFLLRHPVVVPRRSRHMEILRCEERPR